MQVQDREIHSLKYLEFVQLAAVHAIVLFWSIYNFAKENSGPLKPGVQTVEGTVKTVIGPVYEKFHGVPFEILKFADRKVWLFSPAHDKSHPANMHRMWSLPFYRGMREIWRMLDGVQNSA